MGRRINHTTGGQVWAIALKDKPLTHKERKIEKTFAKWQAGADALDAEIEAKRKRRHQYRATPRGVCSDCLLPATIKMSNGKLLHTGETR